MELLISRGQPWASSRLPVHRGPGGRPQLPQMDTHPDRTAFILNNKRAAHLNVPQMTNGCCGAEDATGFTLQICRSPQAGNKQSGGLCAARLSTLIGRFNRVEESLRVKLRCGSPAAGSAISSFLWAGGRPTTKLYRHAAIT